MLKISKPQLFTVALVGLIMISSTCRKPQNCVENKYAFQMGVKAVPSKDSVAVGDTILILLDEPTSLKDLNSGATKDYSGAENLGTAIGFQEIIGSAPQIGDVANDFNLQIIEGTEVIGFNRQLFREFLFREVSGRYLFRLGLIPKRPGIFRINLSGAANVFRKTDKCTKASFQFNFKNSDQHFYLYPGGTGTPSGGGIYYFKVK